jgi:hypothetical protein
VTKDISDSTKARPIMPGELFFRVASQFLGRLGRAK